MSKTLLILSYVGKAAGFVGALNAIPFVTPAQGVIIFFIASLLKDTVNRIGDFLDDGKVNSSFISALAATLIVGVGLTGCAGTKWVEVGNDLVADFNASLVAASDAYAAYQAINEQLTTANVKTGKLDFTKVLASAQAIKGTLSASPELKQAVSDLVTAANATITDLKGAPPTAVINAVSQQGADQVTTISALTQVPAPAAN